MADTSGTDGTREQTAPRWLRTAGGVSWRLLVVTAAVPTAATDTTLARLAATLTGLTVGVLVVALLVARWVCRRALAPVFHQWRTSSSLVATG